jgi:hypothetical protein
MAVMTEARARGIAVPGDLGVVGFGDLEFAATLAPALTTVRIDGSRLARSPRSSSSIAPAARTFHSRWSTSASPDGARERLRTQ